MNPALQLRAELLGCLEHHIGRGERVALIDFPNHPNVGDAAIWLGELAALRELGAELVYVCETGGFGEPAIRGALGGGGTVLLHGGGNLGDTWPEHQALRERIVASLPDMRIVQLPQTIHFEHEASLARTRAIVEAHPDLTLLVRDRKSLETARGDLGTKADLCPDAAFGLAPIRRDAPRSARVLFLTRTDSERSGPRVQPDPGSDARMVDWLSEGPGDPGWTPGYQALRRLGTQWAAPLTRRTANGIGVVDRLYRRAAGMRVDYGLKLLASAEVVVTDRLHGHILCLMLGVHHVVLDTGYGKLRNYLADWPDEGGLTRVAGSPEEALELAEDMLGSGRGEGLASECAADLGDREVQQPRL